MDVAGSRRHVDEEEVQRAPVDLQDQLLEGVGCHGTAPYEGLPLLGEVADRHPFHPVFLEGDDVVFPVYFLRNGTVPFSPGHYRHGRSVDVGVGKPHLVSEARQRHRQIHRDGGLAHASFP